MRDATLSSHRCLPFFTPGVWVIAFPVALGAGVALYRFLFGLGAGTNLDQQNPGGIYAAIMCHDYHSISRIAHNILEPDDQESLLNHFNNPKT